MAWFAGRLGETFAILSVLAFAYGGVSIAKAKLYGKGDGGAVLSVVFTDHHCLSLRRLLRASAVAAREVTASPFVASS